MLWKRMIATHKRSEKQKKKKTERLAVYKSVYKIKRASSPAGRKSALFGESQPPEPQNQVWLSQGRRLPRLICNVFFSSPIHQVPRTLPPIVEYLRASSHVVGPPERSVGSLLTSSAHLMPSRRTILFML